MLEQHGALIFPSVPPRRTGCGDILQEPKLAGKNRSFSFESQPGVCLPKEFVQADPFQHEGFFGESGRAERRNGSIHSDAKRAQILNYLSGQLTRGHKH